MCDCFRWVVEASVSMALCWLDEGEPGLPDSLPSQASVIHSAFLPGDSLWNTWNGTVLVC